MILVGHRIFRPGILTPMMEGCHAEMNSVRVTVEWFFGDFINSFKFLDFKKNLKIGMSSVGSNISKTSASVSPGFPNTKKLMNLLFSSVQNPGKKRSASF